MTDIQNSSFDQFLEAVGTLRAGVAPTMRQLEDFAINQRGLPAATHLQLVKATRGIVRPLLESFRGLLEPVAAADQKLGALEAQLERRI